MIPRTRCAGRALALALWAAPWSFAAGPSAADDVESLRASLARDQAALIELISRPRTEDEPPLADDPLLREIAERIPKTQQLLRESASPAGGGASAQPEAAEADQTGQTRADRDSATPGRSE